MKREGPCCHCGIACTPLWRSGPTEKPVLCNACGSRWRIRGTLADYVPKHANQGRRTSNEAEGTEPNFSCVCFEDETTNKSSSGSTSSNETCVHTENINGLDEVKIWDKESIPRRKRSVLSQWVLSPMERLHKDLLQLMHQQQPQEEDELIYEDTNLFSSLQETSYGAMLLQSPNPETKEKKRETLGTEKENKSESPITVTNINPEFPITDKQTKPKSPITEADIKPEPPCPTDISLGELNPKSIPPTYQDAQNYKSSPCVRKRGRPKKGTKRFAGRKCTSSRDSQDESLNCVKVVSPTERSGGSQLQYNRTLGGEGYRFNSNLEDGGFVEEGAEQVDIPLLSALDLGMK